MPFTISIASADFLSLNRCPVNMRLSPTLGWSRPGPTLGTEYRLPSKEEKRRIVEGYATSGMTRREYSAKHGIAVSTLDYWRLKRKTKLVEAAIQLKRDLTAKAEAEDAKAQRVLGNLYQFGTLGADGSVQPDYAGAAYWYQQAADKGVADGAYRLALLYRDGPSDNDRRE